MTTNNEYYKQIAENLTGQTISGNHRTNYYLKIIAGSYGHSYSQTTCNGKYIKDIAGSVCGVSFTGTHFINYYLKQMAEYFVEEDLPNNYDNYFLGILVEYMVPVSYDGVTLSELEGKSILSYSDGDSATLVAQLTNNGSSVSVSGVSVEFFKNNVSMGTAITDSNGIATKTYTSTGAGDVGFYAKCGSLYSDSYIVEDCYVYATDNTFKNTWAKDTTTIANNTIYLCNNINIDKDISAEFKFKDTNAITFGFVNGAILYKGIFSKERVYNIYWTPQGSSSAQYAFLNTPSISSNNVFKITTENLHKVYWYINGTIQAYRDTNSSYALIPMVREITATPTTIDYIKIKAL